MAVSLRYIVQSIYPCFSRRGSLDYNSLDTPVLLIDKKIMEENLYFMQNYATKNKVNLRPHKKTHKTEYLARLQESIGAVGITVSKLEEAEEMAKFSIANIFITNQIVGESKIKRF